MLGRRLRRPNIAPHIMGNLVDVNLYLAKLMYLNFNPLEVVSRYRKTQLQVGENYAYLFNLRPNIS